jgi:hypothetical protein
MTDASSTFSFCSGFIAGYLVSWSNLVPMLLGIGIGISIKRLPELVRFGDLPLFAQRYTTHLGTFFSSNDGHPANTDTQEHTIDVEIPPLRTRKQH